MGKRIAALSLALFGYMVCPATQGARIEIMNNKEAVSPQYTNRLSREKSPYLLQHQHNPVDWYAWGEDAFAKARADKKPIFLSIGYSTCHWCHVMERESFEDPKLAEFLNKHFVSIKVDREERPDVDKIYMTATQAMGEGGGWPLNVFLTPDLKPFFGGTYFPPEPKYGRASFLQVLNQLAEYWEKKEAETLQSAKMLHDHLVEFTSTQATHKSALSSLLLKNAVALYKREYDSENGGFARAPKFPRPSQPLLLLWHGVTHKDDKAVQMVARTCEKMAAGGIYDQIGGGFARYSVDEKWLVPHFEKMLYDNAQLIQLYLDVYLVGGDRRHADVVRDVLRYILRDMTHPEGGFFSAEDADSEGKEGKFYCWTLTELKALLNPDELKVAVRYYGVTEKGNFVDHSDPHPLPDQNILSVVDPKLSEAEKPFLESARTKLFNTRAKRIRPHLDDKILASWNGLMLGAIARASIVLDDPDYKKAAEKNLGFIQAKLWDASTRTLYNRWRDGERDKVQLLDAYANMLSGVVELYGATLDPAHLKFAIDIADGMIERFYDAKNGGFWQSAANSTDLILRIKEDYDGAEPSGNSMAIQSLLKLGAICERKDYTQAAEKTLLLFGERMEQVPQAVPYMLAGLKFFLDQPHRVVIAGDRNLDEAKNLLRAAHSVYQPHKVVLGVEGPVEPFAKKLPVQAGKAQVYICAGTECKAPTADPAKVKALLE